MNFGRRSLVKLCLFSLSASGFFLVAGKESSFLNIGRKSKFKIKRLDEGFVSINGWVVSEKDLGMVGKRNVV